MTGDLTKSANVGVRWQAQMEEHLTSVRSFTTESVNLPHDSGAKIAQAMLAQAHATAALALAVANGLGDLEPIGDRIAGAIVDAGIDIANSTEGGK